MNVEKLSISPSLNLEKFLRRGGIEQAEALREEAEQLFGQCAPLVRPKALIRRVQVNGVNGTSVLLDGESFDSRSLATNLSRLTTVHVYVATCGVELEPFMKGGDGLRVYWIDLIKEQALEHIVSEVHRRVADREGCEGMASMNPGSADADVWPIEQQRPLFRLLGDVETRIGVKLTESCLMIPNKSLSGILFPSTSDWVSCKACTREECPNRRAPYEGVLH